MDIFWNHTIHLRHVTCYIIALQISLYGKKKKTEYCNNVPVKSRLKHLEWTYDGAFEQLFGLGRGEFDQKFSKNSNARGCSGWGDV